MKLKLILACSMVAILLSLCAFSSKQVSVKATCSDFEKLYPEHAISKEVKVTVDGSLTVTLCSNSTTGFQWPETAQILADKTQPWKHRHQRIVRRSEVRTKVSIRANAPILTGCEGAKLFVQNRGMTTYLPR